MLNTLSSLPTNTELWIGMRLAYFVPGILLAVMVRKILPWTWLKIAIEFFGVLLHECSHALVGFFLGAQPIGGTLIPKKLPEGGWILGSVRFKNIRWFNGFLTGMAPLLIPLAFIPFIPSEWSLLNITKADTLNWCLMALVLPSSVPSKRDFQVGITSLSPLLVFIALLLLVGLTMKCLKSTVCG